ncbi:MAG: GGDEF domain-containing protein [Thalassotalea sp.]
MSLKSLLNLGTYNQIPSSANKIKLMNIVTLFTVVSSGLYTLNYLLILDQPVVAAINTIFTVAYLSVFVFNFLEMPRVAKTVFFALLMVHLVVCTNIYVTKETGFHLYFFLVPTGAFLLFNLDEKYEKVILSIIATLLFFYCENTVNENPLIELSDQMNHFLYQSVVFINMIEVIFVLVLFVNQIERNELKLYQQAKTDSLTKISNRHHFFEYGESQLGMASELNRPYTLVLFDLDYFKQINDKYGHSAGDECLIEITKTIKASIRQQDLFARIGGEEFVIGMPETTMNEANNITERIRIEVEKHQIVLAKEHKKFNCTASFGIASLSDTARDLKSILGNADKALYKAKEMGRNRVQMYA